MLYEALRFGVQVRSVDDLTDEEYNVALKKTHEYYLMHPTYSHRDRLSCGCGPADATERFTEKAHYVGTPVRFRYYDYREFLKQLATVEPGSTAETASEQSFDKAFEKTHYQLADTVGGQRLEPEMTYRGPQCFSQKSNVAKLTFDLRKARAAAQPVKDLSTLIKSSRFRVLQCEDCERWRRVDERTFAAYQPDSWQKHLQEERW